MTILYVLGGRPQGAHRVPRGLRVPRSAVRRAPRRRAVRGGRN